jgi:hypothetical protein
VFDASLAHHLIRLISDGLGNPRYAHAADMVVGSYMMGVTSAALEFSGAPLTYDIVKMLREFQPFRYTDLPMELRLATLAMLGSPLDFMSMEATCMEFRDESRMAFSKWLRDQECGIIVGVCKASERSLRFMRQHMDGEHRSLVAYVISLIAIALIQETVSLTCSVDGQGNVVLALTKESGCLPTTRGGSGDCYSDLDGRLEVPDHSCPMGMELKRSYLVLQTPDVCKYRPHRHVLFAMLTPETLEVAVSRVLPFIAEVVNYPVTPTDRSSCCSVRCTALDAFYSVADGGFSSGAQCTCTREYRCVSCADLEEGCFLWQGRYIGPVPFGVDRHWKGVTDAAGPGWLGSAT